MAMTTTILIVGDDEETCTFLARILSAKDWRTDQAWVASKALELARSKAYDVVVFDYRQPGLDGADVCRRIREARPDAREIFVTGTRQLRTCQASGTLPPNWLRFVAKPRMAAQKPLP